MAIPSFLTIVMMPFAYSISDGIGFGFISFTLIKMLRGKFKEIPCADVRARRCSSPCIAQVRALPVAQRTAPFGAVPFFLTGTAGSFILK